MEVAKQGLRLLSKALNVAPIPDAFKPAMTAIPDIALQIVEIVDAVKGNVEDAEALAVYIANVTDATMRPFESKPQAELYRSPDTKKRLEVFQGVLEKIKEEMITLMSRRLGSRVLSYESDASTLATMKRSVNDAINQLQMETVVAVGHDVDIMRQDQSRMYEDQRQMNQDHRTAIREQEGYNRMAAQQQAQQQLFIVRQQDMSHQERLLGNGDSGVTKRHPCLAGTREHILTKIKAWVDDASSSSKRSYLLLGQAGTGKSAIASSIANREMASQRLGAVFHFTRDEQARNKGAILVLARQLASWGGHRLRSKIASAIESVVQEGLDIGQMAPENQFQRLIQGPLETLDSTAPGLVIIMDALDECDDTYAITILRLFGKLLSKLPDHLKLFITSRSEPHLQQCYNSDPLKSQLEVHSMADEKMERVEQDIAMYFKERLPDMVRRWVAEPSGWPGEERRRALVRKTQGLFICATTVAGMLADPNFRDPEAQLEGILSSNNIRLDDIYAQILQRACPASSDNDLLELFRNVLGALVVARVPLNIHTLASLLSPDGPPYQGFAYRIRATVLSYLQAVLVVPDVETAEAARDAHPIRFIHTSFVDYLTDKSRCDPRFLLDLSKQHEQLAIGCLRRMRDLRRNMCDLDPALVNSEVDDLAKRIQDNISPGLQYACAQMSAHVSYTPVESAEVRDLVEELAAERLLNWLEGLSLMGRVPEMVGMASLIESWLKASLHLLTISPPPSPDTIRFSQPTNNPRAPAVVPGPTAPEKRSKVKRFFGRLGVLSHMSSQSAIGSTESEEPTVEIFHDLQRFIMAFMDSIVTSSLHIYSSALALMPSETELSRRYGHLAEGSLKVVRGRTEGWSQTLWATSKHSDQISCVAVSPDGTTVISGSDDSTLRLWDAKTGAAIGKPMEGHALQITCMAVSPDSTTIVSGSLDNTLRLWDAKTGEVIGKAMIGHTWWVQCVAVSPNSATIVSGSDDNTLRLWDAKTGEAIGRALKGHTKWVRCVAVSPDGTTIISGSGDHTLRLWDIRTGAPIGKTMQGHTNWVNCVAVTPDSATIVSGSDDGTLCLWNAKTGEAIGKVMKGHTKSVTCIEVTPNGKTIISGSADNTLCLWHAKTGAIIKKVMIPWVTCVAVSPDNTTIISGSLDNTLCLWHAKTGAAIGKAMEGHTGPVCCVVVSPDSTMIVSGSGDSTLRSWDARTRGVTRKAVEGHARPVTCVTVSPDSKTIISGSLDNTLCLWNANTGAVIWKAQAWQVTCLVVSPDSTTVVSGSSNNTLRLWDAKTGVAIGKAMEGHTKSVTCVTVSPNGKTIVSGSDDCTLHLWDAKTSAAIGRVMTGHTGPVSCVAVSPDGTTIISGSNDNTLQLWDAMTRTNVRKTTIGPGVAGLVAFLDDGKHLVSISKDTAETYIWDYTSLKRLSDEEVWQAGPSLKMPNHLLKLDKDGWVRDPRGKRMLWLPVDLRGEVVGRGNIIAVANQKVLVFDVSINVSSV
ncbi:hypothetical protein FRB93_006865 [Tulasnella sp. JGI-2019a]|nr:hypothetical protein FRB93_006865 [Tulasnella sp. JGI-2019a]